MTDHHHHHHETVTGFWGVSKRVYKYIRESIDIHLWDLNHRYFKYKEGVGRNSNLKGQLISTLMNKNVVPGSYSVSWDASNLTSGLYVFSVAYGDKTYNQKVTLVK